MRKVEASHPNQVPPTGLDENPEWTGDDFAHARLGSEVLPRSVVSNLTKNKGGRPRASEKEQVSLRIDRDTLTRYRKSGPGWQTRMNQALKVNIGEAFNIDVHEAYEVHYWTRKFDVSEQDLRDAVEKVGASAPVVAAYFDEHRGS